MFYETLNRSPILTYWYVDSHGWVRLVFSLVLNTRGEGCVFSYLDLPPLHIYAISDHVHKTKSKEVQNGALQAVGR